MSHRTVYQLGPTTSFTEPQRRELNALWLRLTSDLDSLLDEATIAPQAELPTTGNAVTDANLALVRIKLNEIVSIFRLLGATP